MCYTSCIYFSTYKYVFNFYNLFFHTKKAPYKDAFQQIIFGCPRNKLVFEVRLLSPRFELERFLVRLSGLV